MRRRIFTLASAVSLLLFLGTVVLWVRGVIEIEAFEYSRYRADVEGSSTYVDDSVLSGFGELTYIHSVDHRVKGESFRPSVREQVSFERRHGTHGQASVNESYYNHVIRRRWWLAGIGWGAVDEHPIGSHYTASGMSVPSCVLLVATAILPAIWLTLLARRHRRRKLGLCPNCAYSLTGNISGVCPECGTAVEGMVHA